MPIYNVQEVKLFLRQVELIPVLIKEGSIRPQKSCGRGSCQTDSTVCGFFEGLALDGDEPCAICSQGVQMPKHVGRGREPATSVGRNQRKLSPRSHSSRVGKAWTKWTETGHKNFSCPICGEAVRYLRIRGSLSPQIECSNPLCRWTIDELVRESSIPELAQKPKGVSSRQWFEASRVVG